MKSLQEHASRNQAANHKSLTERFDTDRVLYLKLFTLVQGKQSRLIDG